MYVYDPLLSLSLVVWCVAVVSDAKHADIDLVTMTTSGKDFARAGNLLVRGKLRLKKLLTQNSEQEIWLDFLSFRSCANSSFIMESHFDALLRSTFCLSIDQVCCSP